MKLVLSSTIGNLTKGKTKPLIPIEDLKSNQGKGKATREKEKCGCP